MMGQQETAVTIGVGDTVAPFALPVYGAGRTVAWRPGMVTVFSFCALWCDTWREQSVRLLRTQNALAGLPIQFVTVSVDGRWAERFQSGNRTGQVLLDVGGKVSAVLGVRAVPYTFVVDERGIVRFAHQGIVRSEDLTVLLRSLATTGFSPVAARPVLYLTFDDFPTVKPGAVFSDDEELLDVLRAQTVPATFFCIGEHLTTSAGMACARRAVREGHELQVHSWSHHAADPQLNECFRIMERIAPGVSPTLYRPPGSSEIRVCGKRPASFPDVAHLPIVNPYDFARPGEAEMLRHVSNAVRSNAVLQFHAGVAQTRNILPSLIASLNRRGFVWERLH